MHSARFVLERHSLRPLHIQEGINIGELAIRAVTKIGGALEIAYTEIRQKCD
jgi:hypothetical protein